MVYVICGISGSGKTTVGKSLARYLSLPFFDADDYHSDLCVKKMSAGIPLDDTDRMPWLMKLSQKIREWENSEGAVLACSALKDSYRKILVGDLSESVTFVFLKIEKSIAYQRLNERKGHYFTADMLESQFAVLEAPADAIHAENINPPEETVVKIINEIQRLIK
jgi:carbohydrate kinase (thermoresistant glucokinase family)